MSLFLLGFVASAFVHAVFNLIIHGSASKNYICPVDGCFFRVSSNDPMIFNEAKVMHSFDHTKTGRQLKDEIKNNLGPNNADGLPRTSPPYA